MFNYTDIADAKSKLAKDVKSKRIVVFNYSWKEESLKERLEKIAKAVSAYTGTGEFRTELDDRSYYDDEFMYEAASGMFYRGSFLLNSFNSKMKRLRFTVGSSYMTMFDICGVKPDDLVRECIRAKNKVLSELAYEHLVLRGHADAAKRLFADMIESRHDRAPQIVIASNVQAEYWPAMRYYSENRKQKPDSMTLYNYMKTIYRSGEKMDRELYSFVLKNFKSELKKTDFSNNALDNDDVLVDREVSNFDLMESDAGFRTRVIEMSDYKYRRQLDEMANQDKVRLAKIAVRHFNDAHPKGKGKRKFLRSYSAIKRYVDINVFDLNKELQGYILLDIIQ